MRISDCYCRPKLVIYFYLWNTGLETTFSSPLPLLKGSQKTIADSISEPVGNFPFKTLRKLFLISNLILPPTFFVWHSFYFLNEFGQDWTNLQSFLVYLLLQLANWNKFFCLFVCLLTRVQQDGGTKHRKSLIEMKI